MNKLLGVILISSYIVTGDNQPPPHKHTTTITLSVVDKDSPDHKSQAEAQKNCWERLPNKIKIGILTAVGSVLSSLLTGLLVNNARC